MKTIEGIIISDRMAKTAVVLVERKTRHPLYGKIISKKRKIHARNEIGAKMGQVVRITQVKPLAKTVSFKIQEIVGVKEIKENPVEVRPKKEKLAKSKAVEAKKK